MKTNKRNSLELPRFAFFAAMLFCFSIVGNSQQVNFRNYSVADGLAQSQVFAITEDAGGYLWFGTKGGGLSRFDGLTFKNYTIRDGLINDFVNCILKLRNGNLCIGTNIGISIYDGKSFNNYQVGRDSIGLPVQALAEDAEGKIWIATTKGMYLLKNDQITCFVCKHDHPREIISCIYIDNKQKVWYGDDFGLNRIDSIEGKIRITPFRRKEGFTNVLVRTIREEKNGTLIIGTYGGGLHQLRGKMAVPFAFNKNLESRIIHDLLIDSKGDWWFSTYDAGIYRLRTNDSSLVHYGLSEGLANDHASVLFEDSWGNIWAGTSGGGVSRFSGERFKHYTERNGLPGNYVYSVCPQGDSLLWLGTSAKGVVRMNLNSGIHQRFGVEQGFVEEKIKTIHTDSSGNIWLGTEGEGLWIYDSTGFKKITTKNGLSGNWIKDILIAKSGDIWIATAGGGISVIQQREPLRIKKISEKNGLSRNRINALLEDHQGRIWYASEGGGVGMISENGIKNFTTVNGLSGNLVRSLREDQNGFLWVATGGGGLSRIDIYRDMSIDRITRDNGLSSDNLYLLEIDQQNNLWAGSENGVDRILLSENSEVREIKHYGKAEGFMGIETCQNSVALTPDGSIWFGTIDGLTRHDPRNSDRNLLPPRLQFTSVNLFYQPLQNTRFSAHVENWGKYRDQLELNYDENHIGFEFIGIDHRNPSSVKYQWKLEGADTSWSPLSLKHDVTYSNLLPGDYTFTVRAVNEDGIMTASPLNYHFRIKAPWWQQWWFRFAMIILGMAIIAGIILLVTRRARKRVQSMREKLKVEKKLLELEQKALRLQMNPHFIFHALNSIQGLIVKKDEKTARLYLAKFSKLMRAILENSREQVIPLEKEMETLQDYLTLEQFTRDHSFDFSISTEGEPDCSEIMIPSMLLQPFVENSIIHGFNGLDRRGKIEIVFRMVNNTLECIVRDNGVGREKALQNRMQQDSHHKSMALIVTQERLDLLRKQSGEKTPAEPITITDLAEGTEVLVRIQIS
ncbi:MAG TPA: two-component regulator propeller domain-containing protein [Flavobacteriales bacterium]|nr:two-component regulator propeller domain-containing protein [Flavobacteriales bacterium]HRJ37673.1 two-component regulator propeller domain-containing protein [Flavobacteriales bacterium]